MEFEDSPHRPAIEEATARMREAYEQSDPALWQEALDRFTGLFNESGLTNCQRGVLSLHIAECHMELAVLNLATALSYLPDGSAKRPQALKHLNRLTSVS